MAEIRANSLGKTVASPEIINQEIGTRPISIVISYCATDIAWIPDYITNNNNDVYIISDIIVFSKCGNTDIKGLEALDKIKTKVEVVIMPNLGRCDHAYSYWISNHFNRIETIQKTKHEKGLLLFIKDNNHSQSYFRPFKDMFLAAARIGFGCAQKPQAYIKTAPWKPEKLAYLMYHDKSILGNFTLGEYIRDRNKERDIGQDIIFGSEHLNVKHWVDAMNISLPDTEFIPACYGTYKCDTNEMIFILLFIFYYSSSYGIP